MDSAKASSNPFLRAAASGVSVSTVDPCADALNELRTHFASLEQELARIPVPNGPNDTGVLLANKWDFFNLANQCAYLGFHSLALGTHLFKYYDQFDDKDAWFERVQRYMREAQAPARELYTMLSNIPGEIQDRWAEQEGHVPIPGGFAYRSAPRGQGDETLINLGMLAVVEKAPQRRDLEESQQVNCAESQYMDLLSDGSVTEPETDEETLAPVSNKRKRSRSPAGTSKKIKQEKEDSILETGWDRLGKTQNDLRKVLGDSEAKGTLQWAMAGN